MCSIKYSAQDLHPTTTRFLLQDFEMFIGTRQQWTGYELTFIEEKRNHREKYHFPSRHTHIHGNEFCNWVQSFEGHVYSKGEFQARGDKGGGSPLGFSLAVYSVDRIGICIGTQSNSFGTPDAVEALLHLKVNLVFLPGRFSSNEPSCVLRKQKRSTGIYSCLDSVYILIRFKIGRML